MIIEMVDSLRLSYNKLALLTAFSVNVTEIYKVIFAIVTSQNIPISLGDQFCLLFLDQ